MKSALRSIKNEIKKYDEGQRMVRGITANTEDVPTIAQLSELTNYCRNDMVSGPTYDVLWQRLTDYQTLRHVEKALLVIEHLINYGTKKFIRVCLARKSEFQKLTKYVYKIDGSDIGQNVRTRAKECHRLLQDERIINKTGASSAYDDYNSNYYNHSSAQAPAKPDTPAASYDDYFSTVDKLDAENMKQRQRDKDEKAKQEKEIKEAQMREEEEEREREEKRKKKKSKKKSKKKTKKTKKKSKKKQEHFVSSDEDNTVDPFSNTNGFENDNNGGFDNSDPFFNDGTGADPDPFSDTTGNGNNTMKAPPKTNMNKLKSVSNDHDGGDDLLDFFSAPAPVATNKPIANTNNTNYNQIPQTQDQFGATASVSPVDDLWGNGTSTNNNNNNDNPFKSSTAAAVSNDPFASSAAMSNDDPFASSSTAAVSNDPFFSTNNANVMANNNQNNNYNNMNNNMDPFAALGF